jgi:choline-sulfatase
MSHNFSRREWIAGATASAAAAQTTAQSKSKPNMILWMPETLRADGLACYGHPLVSTPNYDRLAKEGVRFTDCHTQNTVCGPSRCSLMTGWPVHVRGHRSLYYFLHPDEPNLLRYLKDAGYDIYFFGKNDVFSTETFPPSVTEWGSKGSRIPANDRPRNPYSPDDPRFFSFLYTDGGDRHDYPDYVNLESAIKIIERDSKKPWCIYLPQTMVHPPFAAPKDFYGMYDPKQVPALRPPNLPGKPNYYEAIRRTRRLNKLDDAFFRQIQAVYLGMLSYSDWLLGEMLAALERTGHDKDTAFFVFSDHGEWGGDYGLVEKWPSACDDVLNHVPLIARIPGAAKGHVSKEPVELYDVMATCLELAGVEAQHTHFARSLMPQVNGRPGDPSRAVFCEGGYNTYEPQCFEPLSFLQSDLDIYAPKVKLQNEHPETITRATMIQGGHYKLVLRPDGESEFYDLAKDPRELHNVYSDRMYAGPREELHGQLLNWYVRTADVAPKQHDPRGFPGSRVI